jgi:hypothetical protein
MVGANSLPHINNSSASNVKPVTHAGNATETKQKEHLQTLEFKNAPALSKLSDSNVELTGTYNRKGKLGLISDKMIVYVQPSAYIRDKLVPAYKVG